MNKKLVIGVGAVAVVAYLGTVAYIKSYDSSRSETLIAQVASPKGDADIRALFYEKGCDYCHTTKASMPFYASLPVAKQLMNHDIITGYRHFNLIPTLEALEKGTPIPESDLAKIERVVQEQEMPPVQFKLVHVSSGLDGKQSQQILDWVAKERQQHYVTAGVAAEFKNETVQPIPESIPTEPLKVALGYKLYHDNRLSGDNSLSCETCHKLDGGGVDNLVTSTGIDQQKGPINAPTVFNSVFNMAQFWDGRAGDLQEQAGGPPLNPIEMGSHSWEQIIDKLAPDEALVQEFAKVYPNEGITSATITDAIAEFEKTLITPNSPFDRYLKGDAQALSESQIRGFKLFKEQRCDTCHVGKNLGGQSYDLMGLKGDYFADRGSAIEEADIGRYNVSKYERDRYRFKTPTLRNIEQTAPYLHDGSIADLEGVVNMMLKYQVGKTLPEQDVKDIVAFLQSLTGEYVPYQPETESH
jgi:cytochrome c peroxidase